MFDSNTVVSQSVQTILWQAGEMTDEDGNIIPTVWEDAHDIVSAHMTTEYQILGDFYGFLNRCSYEDVEAYLDVRSTTDFIHDYWLTRNHHGAGFWDRGLGDLGDRLTFAAQSDSEYSVWESVDGTAHVDGYVGWFYE